MTCWSALFATGSSGMRTRSTSASALSAKAASTSTTGLMPSVSHARSARPSSVANHSSQLSPMPVSRRLSICSTHSSSSKTKQRSKRCTTHSETRSLCQKTRAWSNTDSICTNLTLKNSSRPRKQTPSKMKSWRKRRNPISERVIFSSRRDIGFLQPNSQDRIQTPLLML